MHLNYYLYCSHAHHSYMILTVVTMQYDFVETSICSVAVVYFLEMSMYGQCINTAFAAGHIRVHLASELQTDV